MPQHQPQPDRLIVQDGPFEGLPGVSGTEAAIIAGMSPWSSPAELWAQRVGLLERTERESAEMNWGSFLENPILQAYAEQEGVRVWRPTKPVIHPTRRWMYGHLDGRAKGHIIEAKTARLSKGWGEERTDAIPDHYYTQVQHYIACADVEWAAVPVLFAGSDFRVYIVPRADDYIEALEEVEAHFMEAVLRQEEPDLDGSDATARYLRRRYPDAEGEVVATAEQAALIEQYAEAKDMEGNASKVRKTLENQVKGVVGEHMRMWAPGYVVKWPKIERKAPVNWEAIAKAYRRIIEDPTVSPSSPDDLDAIESLNTGEPSEYRRFTLTEVANDAA